MRSRWRTVAELWDVHKSQNTRSDLAEQLDYWGKLSSQLESEHGIRLVYASAGKPTAAVLRDQRCVVDYKLFWVPCGSLPEARFLAAVINTQVVEQAVAQWMSKGQFGSRDLQKHLWRLDVPGFDTEDSRHVELAELGEWAEAEAAARWAELRTQREEVGRSTSVTAVRSDLRAWLHDSDLGRRIDRLVADLLGLSGT